MRSVHVHTAENPVVPFDSGEILGGKIRLFGTRSDLFLML